ERLYRQEVLGEYLSMDGSRVYSSFSEEEHLTDLAVDPTKPLFWALDFNVDPMSSVVAQIDRGEVRVLDEVVIRQASTQDACEVAKRKFGRHTADVVIDGDASGDKQQMAETSDYAMVQEYFRVHTNLKMKIKAARSNPLVRDRINLMNRTLRSAAGDIHMRVDRKCKELVKDFVQVSYKSDRSEIDKERDRQRTHTSDALGYLIWEECRPKQQVGERAQPIF